MNDLVTLLSIHIFIKYFYTFHTISRIINPIATLLIFCLVLHDYLSVINIVSAIC